MHRDLAESATGSLVGTTIRRGLSVGWRYLVIGVGVSVFLALVLLLADRSGVVFRATFPLDVPLFAVLGSMGGLMTFTSDRTKGVFEYLIAYGVPPRTLFVDGLFSTAAMTGIVVGLSLLVGVGAAAAYGVALTRAFAETLALYTLPMSFASAFFTATAGMIWSSISTPRTGINSPLGIAPMLGVAPTLVVAIVASNLPAADYYYFTAGAALAIVGAVLLLLAMSARLMGRERFLSPL